MYDKCIPHSFLLLVWYRYLKMLFIVHRYFEFVFRVPIKPVYILSTVLIILVESVLRTTLSRFEKKSFLFFQKLKQKFWNFTLRSSFCITLVRYTISQSYYDRNIWISRWCEAGHVAAKKRRTCSNTGYRNRVGQGGAVVSHFEIIGGRRVLCEFKVSAGPCTRAKVANDSLGV